MATWPAKTNYATGDVLTAAEMQDIGNALNSLESAQYSAGKNKIINGDFRINQRAFTSATLGNTYGFDRWSFSASDGTVTYSAQTFTLGTAPVTGYEGVNFARLVTSGQTATSAIGLLYQPIESVRTFANQTVTVSFWAKAGSGTPKVSVELAQNFGTGGSPSTAVNTYAGQVTLSTSWARYSVTIAVPSISGKTLGTNNNDSLRLNLWTSAGTDFNARTNSLGIQSATIDFWGVQVEAGNSATPFQTATGTFAGELAACQRYYYRVTTTAANKPVSTGFEQSGTVANVGTQFPVTMRTIPTALEQSGTAADYRVYGAAGVIACSAVPTFNYASTVMAVSQFTVATGLTAGRACFGDLATTAGYLGWSAEL